MIAQRAAMAGPQLIFCLKMRAGQKDKQCLNCLSQPRGPQQVPVIVLTDDLREEGTLAGSGRSIQGFDLPEALENMADLFIIFGGPRKL